MESNPIPAIVQYHTKGEFQPVIPTVSITQADQFEPESEILHPNVEPESEIFHPNVEQPLHESSEISNIVEEAYVAPVEYVVEKEQATQYNAWDASRSALVSFYENVSNER